MRIIKQGAESIIYLDNNLLVKERIIKTYRLSEIDYELRKIRTKKEAKLLKKINFSPEVFEVDENKMKIIMEYVDGELLRDVLENLDDREEVCRIVGNKIAELHSKDIIHGDLTSSNIILKGKNVYFIDFGLGFISKKIEDKAVDFHLLKQALESKHYKISDECIKSVLEGYKEYCGFDEVVSRLKKVEKRGRYK